jgi:hypothetical protein
MTDSPIETVAYLVANDDVTRADLAEALATHVAGRMKAEVEIDRLRKALLEIATGRPDIPEGADGEGPNWPMHVFALMWARYCTELQGIARAALGEDRA